MIKTNYFLAAGMMLCGSAAAADTPAIDSFGALSIEQCLVEPDPARIVCEITNVTDTAIASIQAVLAVVEPGRTVPWGDVKSEVRIPGGVEPGEGGQVDFPIAGLPSEGWEQPLVPVGALMAIALDGRRLQGPDLVTPEPRPSSPIRAEPPLTGAERSVFRAAVQGCWVVDPASEASRVIITVGFLLTPDGRVQDRGVVMIGNSGGSYAAVRTAFEAVERAILRCQGDGYPLPPEKYEQWRTVEMSFNPEDMRIR